MKAKRFDLVGSWVWGGVASFAISLCVLGSSGGLRSPGDVVPAAAVMTVGALAVVRAGIAFVNRFWPTRPEQDPAVRRSRALAERYPGAPVHVLDWAPPPPQPRGRRRGAAVYRERPDGRPWGLPLTVAASRAIVALEVYAAAAEAAGEHALAAEVRSMEAQLTAAPAGPTEHRPG